ncbi:hypothetical protein ABXS71_16915 [Bacillus infantis]|uniref:hypothetical protein n=1 Tax=Bacillus infantis TaxID=324767 RepID=UPI003450724D
MVGKVETWYMTKEELAAYVEKHPIRRTEKPKGSSFANVQTDYKWRPKKANAQSIKATRG